MLRGITSEGGGVVVTYNDSQVVAAFGDMVYRLAYARTGQRCDADDIFQEVFLRYVSSARQFESDEHLKAWLLRVTVSRCNKHHSSTWNQRTEALDERMAAPDAADGSVLSAVQALPDKYRAAVHLFYYEGYSTREIAQLTDTRESTVRTQLTRARELLRTALKGDFFYEPEVI